MTPSTEPSIFDLLEPLADRLLERGGPDIRTGFARATGGADLPYLIDVLSGRNVSQMLPEAAGVKDMSLVERVARAIIAGNERRERSATHGMEIVAEAALKASGHAELVEALWQAANALDNIDMFAPADPTAFAKSKAAELRAVAAKHTGEQS